MASPARGSHVWVGSETGILKGVNLQKKQATNYRTGEATLTRREAVTAMCWGDSYESEIFVGSLDGSVRLFSTEKGKFIESRDCQGGEGPFCGLAILDGSLITCVESGLMKIWRDSSSENVEIQVGPGVCRMRQSSEQLHRFATGGKENCLKIWDLHQPQEPVFRAKNVRHDWLDLRVPIWDQDMEFLPGSEKIVTCTGHHQVRLYDPSCPQRRPVLEATFGEYPLTSLSLTSDANTVVVGSSHGDVAVIDLRQGRLLKCLKGFAGSVRAIRCHPSLPVVASCGLDRFLRLHNLHSQRLEHKVYLKSRLNCLLLTTREKWESEDLEPSVNLPDEVKEEEDDLWNSLEVVASKRKADEGLGARTESPKPSKDTATKKQKKTKKAKLCSRALEAAAVAPSPLLGGARPPIQAPRRAMGCVESKERPSHVDEDTGQSRRATPPPPAPPEEEKSERLSEQLRASPASQRESPRGDSSPRKKKKKIRKKSDQQQKGVEAEKPGLLSRSESAKVTVIWQRLSFFSSTHDSCNKRLEGEAAGPSGRLAEASQINNFSAEDVVRPLDRTVN